MTDGAFSPLPETAKIKNGGNPKMKNQVQNENEIRNYLMFSEFEMSDIDYDVTFNIVDIDFYFETVTVAITDNGRITQDTYQLMKDKDGRFYFEYGRFYEQ